MAKAKDPNGATPSSRKRTTKPSQAGPESKNNVFPINLDEEIRKRAYEMYEQRGSISGYENDDWLAAEREVLSRYQQHTA